MKNTKETNANFRNDGKMITDMIFNTKLFKEDVTRDDMVKVEIFIGECMSMRFESYVKGFKLLASIKESKIIKR